MNKRAWVEKMIARDNCARAMGIEVLDAAPGLLDLRMTVRAEHLNFLGWGHGGVTFAFADTAFGMSSNTYDKVSVGIDAHIVYLSGVKEGDVIEVREKSREMGLILEAVDSVEREVPDYINVDHEKLRGEFIRVPKLADVPYPVQMEPNLVIEYYSR